MPTSNPDWSTLASENERLVDSRTTQVSPRPAPSTPKPAPAARLRWRRRATLAAARELAAVAAPESPTAGAPAHRASARSAFRQAGQSRGGLRRAP
jgi:hypothetical protein